jgi:hypothetical protein
MGTFLSLGTNRRSGRRRRMEKREEQGARMRRRWRRSLQSHQHVGAQVSSAPLRRGVPHHVTGTLFGGE